MRSTGAVVSQSALPWNNLQALSIGMCQILFFDFPSPFRRMNSDDVGDNSNAVQGKSCNGWKMRRLFCGVQLKPAL